MKIPFLAEEAAFWLAHLRGHPMSAPRTPAEVNADLREVREDWPTGTKAQIKRGTHQSKLLRELEVSKKHHIRSVT